MIKGPRLYTIGNVCYYSNNGLLPAGRIGLYDSNFLRRSFVTPARVSEFGAKSKHYGSDGVSCKVGGRVARSQLSLGAALGCYRCWVDAGRYKHPWPAELRRRKT